MVFSSTVLLPLLLLAAIILIGLTTMIAGNSDGANSVMAERMQRREDKVQRDQAAVSPAVPAVTPRPAVHPAA